MTRRSRSAGPRGPHRVGSQLASWTVAGPVWAVWTVRPVWPAAWATWGAWPADWLGEAMAIGYCDVPQYWNTTTVSAAITARATAHRTIRGPGGRTAET